MDAADAARAGHEPLPQPAAPRIAFRPHGSLPWLLLPEGMPMQILPEAAPVRVPNTQHWFRGVASQRGNLLPVFDLAAWADLPIEDDVRPQVVAIGQGAQSCAMLCAGSPTLLNIGPPVDCPTEDGALSPFLDGHYDSALGRAREFDIRRWLATAAQKIASDTAA